MDQFIDKYEIIATLGRGSMGVVYKAKDPEIGRVVAIKTLRAVFLGQDAAGEEALQRFRQEARSAGRLRHPNIVTIFDTGRTANGSPYIVMEFIEGYSLETIIMERAPLDPLECLHYLGQIASAVDYAHSQVVIHRDIKPSNVIVSAEGRPHLLDFGVAKLSDTSLTPAGTVVGTPSYMSPEQIRGERLDGATDRFALAVMAFEMFTGVRPFPGSDFTTVVGNIIHKPPVPFAEMGVNFPAGLEQVFHRGLAKEREKRFPSAQDFADAIAAAFHVAVDAMGVPGFRPGTKLSEVTSRRPESRTLTQAISRQSYTTAADQKGPRGASAAAAVPQGSRPEAPLWEGFSKPAPPPVDETAAFPKEDPAFVEEQFPALEEEPPTMTAAFSQAHRAFADEPYSAPGKDPSPLDRSERLTRAKDQSPGAGFGGGFGAGAAPESEERGRRGVAKRLFFAAAILAVVLASLLGYQQYGAEFEKLPSRAGAGDKQPQEEQPDADAGAGERIEEEEEKPKEPEAADRREASGKENPDKEAPPATEPAPVEPEIPPAEPELTAEDEGILLVLQNPGQEPGVLIRTLAGLSGRDLGPFRDALLNLAVHPNYLVRIETLKLIGKSGGLNDDILFQVVAARLSDTDRLVRGFAAKTLAVHPSVKAQAAVQKRLTEETDEVVLKVLRGVHEKMQAELKGAGQ
jgi:serine/threonine protein kinase